MDATRIAAGTREGGTAEDKDTSKGDKGIETPRANSDQDGGGEPISEDDPKPTDKGL